MRIDAHMKINEDFANLKETFKEVASGWVTIEDVIKFPVKVRTYTDKEDGKEKMFVHYPSKKSESGYDKILYPENKGLRMDIEERVFEEVKKQITKDMQVPPIDDVRVSLLPHPVKTGNVTLNGMATVKMLGLVINGIMIKESDRGLFVQMPQYRADGQYKDTVYGTNKGVQKEIEKEVLLAYEKKIEQTLQIKEPVPEEQKIQRNVEGQKMSEKGPKL